jgi:hypothetical protein
MERPVGLIEATSPGTNKLIDPCRHCRCAEGVFCVAWPDVPADEWFLVCGHCLWRKFHDVPRGPRRRAMLRKVFTHRIFGRSLKTSR